jgi:hypothetical protein
MGGGRADLELLLLRRAHAEPLLLLEQERAVV